MTENANDVAAELFNLLESNKLKDVDEIKKVFHDHFLSTKDNWLVNGLFDYYLYTNSPRAIEVLASVREPHDKHLLDRLAESVIKPGSHGHRIRGLIFLGHVARRQPTWLHKLVGHPLFKELLKILKVEGNALSLMSSLLLLVTLLPMLPAALGPFLHEIFEVFSRLASFHYQRSLMTPMSTSSNHSTSPSFTNSSVVTIHEKDRLFLIHLQVALYSLFHRLYAMYPCNFISYLKQQYSQRDQTATFTHTIRPMLDSVRMHPRLITMSKDAEIAPARWKKIQHHDIVAECGRFALDRRRRGDVVTPHFSNRYFTPIPDHNFSQNITEVSLNEEEGIFWSPSMLVPPHSPPLLTNTTHESRSTPSTPNNNKSKTSPPEAAVEATPETTPTKNKISSFRNQQQEFHSPETSLESFSKQIHRLRFLRHFRRTASVSKSRRRTRSCSDMDILDTEKVDIGKTQGGRLPKNASWVVMEEVATQTVNLIPYEELLVGILDQDSQIDENYKTTTQVVDGRMSPSAFLDQYIENCVRTNCLNDGISKTKKQRSRNRKGMDEKEDNNEDLDDDGSDDCVNQHLQLMHMQLQFERQRREVHAERNRRLLGKLRDSRALEERNNALTCRLKLTESEMEILKTDMERAKKDAQSAEEKYTNELQHWQTMCVEEQQQNKLLKDRVKALEAALKSEQKKLTECEKQTRAAEAALFDAAHQLKGALKAASRGEELKLLLDSVQRRFLLLGEIQSRMQERTTVPTHLSRHENLQMQKSYSEELLNLRKQLESRNSLIEALRSRLAELESRDSSKDSQLLEQQRQLQQAKERHEAELEAVESKYKAQVEINLLLEGRILELHGILETATNCRNTVTTASVSAAINLALSASPKERSPPLSASLASSSEGSLAYIQSAGTPGIVMNDCCDPGGEIANLQAIIEPPTVSRNDDL